MPRHQRSNPCGVRESIPNVRHPWAPRQQEATCRIKKDTDAAPIAAPTRSLNKAGRTGGREHNLGETRAIPASATCRAHSSRAESAEQKKVLLDGTGPRARTFRLRAEAPSITPRHSRHPISRLQHPVCSVQGRPTAGSILHSCQRGLVLLGCPPRALFPDRH